MMKRIFGLVLVVAGFAVVSAQEAPQAPRAVGAAVGAAQDRRNSSCSRRKPRS